MTTVRTLPRHRRSAGTRSCPARTVALVAFVLAAAGCTTPTAAPGPAAHANAPAGGSAPAAPTLVDDGLRPPPEVNRPALTAFSAAVEAATRAGLAGDDPAQAAVAAAETFLATLEAKAPPSLVLQETLATEIPQRLIVGIAEGGDGVTAPAPRYASIAEAIAASANQAGFPCDAAAVAAIFAGYTGSLPSKVSLEIRLEPKHADQILREALAQAPAEHDAIVAAAVAAAKALRDAPLEATLLAHARNVRVLRRLKDSLRADPAQAARHLAQAIRDDPQQVEMFLAATKPLAPARTPAASEVDPEQVLLRFRAALQAEPANLLDHFIAAVWQHPELSGKLAQTAATLAPDRAAVMVAIIVAFGPAGTSATAATTAATMGANAAVTAPVGGATQSSTHATANTGTVVSPPTATPSAGPKDHLIPNRDFVTMQVMYGTDRKRSMGVTDWVKTLGATQDSTADTFYGPQREPRRADFHFGRAVVSMPAGTAHTLGKTERPGVLSSEKLTAHFMLRGIRELDQASFAQEIGRLTLPDPGRGRPDGRDAFIFIHGFNVSFNEAVLRAAQMAYDFNFLGAPVVYSWASRGSAMITAMQHDQDINIATEHKLLEFVEIVQRQTAGDLHLVAHSMGNRALVGVLKKLALVARELKKRGHPLEWRPGRTKLFGEIVLAAPDVSEFLLEPEDAKDLAELAERITLYASDDRALAFARLFSGVRRIGEAGAVMFRAPQVDTVNAAGADQSFVGLRHSYPFEVQTVLADLRAVLVDRAKPDTAPRNLVRDKTTASWQLITPKR